MSSFESLSDSEEFKNPFEEVDEVDDTRVTLVSDGLVDDNEEKDEGEIEDENEDTPEKKKEKELFSSPYVITNAILKIRQENPKLQSCLSKSFLVLGDLMKKAPIIQPQKERRAEVCFTLFNGVVDLLLGEVSQEIKDLLPESHKNASYHELLLEATHSLYPGKEGIFNILSPDTPTEKEELEFLEDMGREVVFCPPAVPLLFQLLDSYSQRTRSEWSATFVKTIHLLLAVFDHRRNQIADAIGAWNINNFESLVLSIGETSPYKTMSLIYSNLIKGKVEHYNVFIFEMILLMVSDKFRSTSFSTPLIYQAIMNANYHHVRCAIDTISPKTLYVCLLSPSYFSDAWLPYMRLYHKNICCAPKVKKENESNENEDITEEDCVDSSLDPPPYETLILYYPSTEVAIPPSPKDIAETMSFVFSQYTTTAFKEGITSVVYPPDFPGEEFKNLFGKKTSGWSAVTPTSSSSSSSSPSKRTFSQKSPKAKRSRRQ